MAGGADRRRADRFTAHRINTLGCWLVLTPVVLWNAVVGMSALVVALAWAATTGVRAANAWVAARASGLPARVVASRVDWWRAAAVLAVAVASTVLTAVALRRLSPVTELLGAPGVVRPVAGALSIILGGAIPGTVLVLASAPSDAPDALASRAAVHDAPARPAPRSGKVGGRGLAALLAAALGVVNVAVLTRLTPLDEWVQGGTGQRIAGLGVLALALAAPATAAWYASRVGRQA
jgi:hypothetical protein